MTQLGGREGGRRGCHGVSRSTVAGRPPTTRSSSVRVFVLPPGARFGGLGVRRSLEQEVVVRRDERVGRRHGVGVVDGPILASEGDPAPVLAQTVLQLSPGLARPLLEPVRRVVDDLLDLGNLDRKSTRLNSSHLVISYAVFCLKKKKK